MYRDNSLMPKEAVRLAALGTLAQAGSLHYGDLAAAVRHFTGRIVGPSLDLMGTSLEMLRYDGLIEALDGTGMEDNARLGLTGRGREELATLLRANVRSPSSDDLNKLVIALKLRFLHLLGPEDQAEQVDALIALYETELARLADLARHHQEDSGLLAAWLGHDMGQVEARLAWFRDLLRRLPV
jgi:DNA-binding PadR family transcriptional regulator